MDDFIQTAALYLFNAGEETLARKRPMRITRAVALVEKETKSECLPSSPMTSWSAPVAHGAPVGCLFFFKLGFSDKVNAQSQSINQPWVIL